MTTATHTSTLRQPTLDTLGLGSVLDIFKNGQLPANAAELVDAVFGPGSDRGAFVVSGANGIVGAGKTMQLGSRLTPYGVPIVALDFPGAPDGIGKQYPGLIRAFGKEGADAVMRNIIRLTYDGKNLPSDLQAFRPRFLLEAIPEILEIKRAHYAIFREAFPDIAIRSVTSGFPSKELGVGIAHPAFPHEINKIYEIVEEEPSDITKLLWALGLIPMRVSDDWSFVLDVLFCGVTLAGTRYHHARNMPYWKIDKFVRRLAGPNPFRAHDAIGAKGANFLTWSCLHHLGEQYGGLFTPSDELVAHKDAGQDWYPPNHFRPLVDWSLAGETEDEFNAWMWGPLFQMTTLMVHEKRSHLAQLNFIGEACAQFRNGILAVMRRHGADGTKAMVDRYHQLFPAAKDTAWHPEALAEMDGAEWQQLYVNAEHDGDVGVITLGREAYNGDVDAELNRAIDWLTGQGVKRVILTGDFHLSTQLVGADTVEFYPALEHVDEGFRVSNTWSKTARRLADEFETSVGFVHGKRCLGGMLELMVHCDYLVATDDATLGFPEVTLPVVPGMEGCHWPFRKADAEHWPNLVHMLLSGQSVKAANAVGWMVDYAGALDDALATAWKLATGSADGITKRDVASDAVTGIPTDVPNLPPTTDPATDAARKAIMDCVQASAGVSLGEAVDIQSKHSAGFMVTNWCRKGRVGSEYTKTMKV